MKRIALGVVGIEFVTSASAQTVSVKDGNILSHEQDRYPVWREDRTESRPLKVSAVAFPDLSVSCGKEVGPVGEDTSNFEATFGKE